MNDKFLQNPWIQAEKGNAPKKAETWPVPDVAAIPMKVLIAWMGNGSLRQYPAQSVEQEVPKLPLAFASGADLE